MDPSTPEPHGPQQPEAAGGPVRPAEIVAGDFLLTLNPVDGSGIESCPPGRRPIATRTFPAAEDAARPGRPLLERDEARERLGRRLARGRSVRVTGPSGSGRTALLSAVARDCADLAPDGVIHLSGYRRTLEDLQQELYAATHHAPGHRPGRTELRGALRAIGAVVVIDDVECDNAALGRLLDATPECAFLLATAPGAAAPPPDPRFEDLALTGLSHAGCRELLELVVERPLTDAESDWAGDLLGANDGLPTRFLQVGALLRARDAGRVGGLLPEPGAVTGMVAGTLSEAGLEVLRLATALGGLVPATHQLPALAGDPQAGTARAELADRGLITATGGHWRLAAGVAEELTRAGQADHTTDRARTAVQHYTWWFSDADPELAQVAEEAEMVLAAAQAAQRRGHEPAVASLGRVAAPRLAAALRWGAWERMLRAGQEAARAAGFVDAQAYFHHELGVLAICGDRLDRARAELEASVGLRGVLADSGGVHAGRRALALVGDLTMPARQPPAATPVTGASDGPGAAPAGAGLPGAPASAVSGAAGAERPENHVGAEPAGSEDDTALLAAVPPTGTAADAPSPRRSGWRRLAVAGTRRNAAAAGAGTLIAAVLGTVVTLGLLSDENDSPGDDHQPVNDPVTTPDTATPENDADSPSPDDTDDADDESPVTDEPTTEEEPPAAPPETDDPTGEETADPPATSSPPDDGGADGGEGSPSPSDPPSPTPTPTDPADPSDPQDPTDPEDPTDPTDPQDPTDPEDPTDPTDPQDPTDPEDPSGPPTASPTTSPTPESLSPTPDGVWPA